MTPAQAKALALNGMAHQRIVRYESALKNVTDIQCSHGNWNCNSYMMGMANGLILAMSLLTGENPEFKSAPEQWLDDRGDFEPEVTSPEEEAQHLLSQAVVTHE